MRDTLFRINIFVRSQCFFRFAMRILNSLLHSPVSSTFRKWAREWKHLNVFVVNIYFSFISLIWSLCKCIVAKMIIKSHTFTQLNHSFSLSPTINHLYSLAVCLVLLVPLNRNYKHLKNLYKRNNKWMYMLCHSINWNWIYLGHRLFFAATYRSRTYAMHVLNDWLCINFLALRLSHEKCLSISVDLAIASKFLISLLEMDASEIFPLLSFSLP